MAPEKWWMSVRSLLTLALCFTFCYLAVMGKVPVETFSGAVMMAISYYFALKSRPSNGNHEPEENQPTEPEVPK